MYFLPISKLGALIVYIQCNDTQNKGSGCREICILCQQTSQKGWFGNMDMTSNCDVTNSVHQTQMTTVCHWMKTPTMKIFCVRHCHQPSITFKSLGTKSCKVISHCKTPVDTFSYRLIHPRVITHTSKLCLLDGTAFEKIDILKNTSIH